MASQTTLKRPPKLILGCSNFGSPSDPFCRTTSAEEAAVLLSIFGSYGHDTIDTARRYPPQAPGTSEELLGEALDLLRREHKAETDIMIQRSPEIHVDTKVLSAPGCHKPENIQESISASLSALHVSSVNTIYLHYPDKTVPLSEPVAALSSAVANGQAKQWGVCNYTLDEVWEILRLCNQYGWRRPAVYQGEHNALNRVNEQLIKFCHEQGIAFYAYSPAAAGVFSPSGSRVGADTPAGQRIRALYGGTEMRSAVQEVRDAARRRGLSGHEVAIRWAFWDSILDGAHGDGVIIGVSNQKQLTDTCEFLGKGGLGDGVREVVEKVWDSVKPK
ncbi:uncharacterized protein Z519_02891 [Cladophialophora bantiana CBS 173.52]|uniref:NADP-dependent oxidoreductase domain-containing protein n=1 Tax=Cladophialophora bantiana (strain ATCC 10958 / CBS 173.52 / CDC B-1940 / NIH 8579) TaxID=1442370 RepID=A0A0D2GB70_CLAB1|nr:uncharacterized protein Z519_02891 [Cladophialophora bantiana CBS 173.52]KIW95827.1 hypothetical protein Z519_02891 [Cladophialophora bantiana CBS 173.52]